VRQKKHKLLARRQGAPLPAASPLPTAVASCSPTAPVHVVDPYSQALKNGWKRVAEGLKARLVEALERCDELQRAADAAASAAAVATTTLATGSDITSDAVAAFELPTGGADGSQETLESDTGAAAAAAIAALQAQVVDWQACYQASAAATETAKSRISTLEEALASQVAEATAATQQQLQVALVQAAALQEALRDREARLAALKVRLMASFVNLSILTYRLSLLVVVRRTKPRPRPPSRSSTISCATPRARRLRLRHGCGT